MHSGHLPVAQRQERKDLTLWSQVRFLPGRPSLGPALSVEKQRDLGAQSLGKMENRTLLAGAAVALIIAVVTYFGDRHYTHLVRTIDNECERLWLPDKLRQAEVRQLRLGHDNLMALLEKSNQALDGPCIPLSMPATDRLKELEGKRISAQSMAQLLSPAGYIVAVCVLLASALQSIMSALRRSSQLSRRITTKL